MSQEGRELIKPGETQDIFESPLAVIADAGIVAIAEQAERRIDAFNKIKKFALKSTNRQDWVNEGGKPYLQDSGANKIARAFGVSWRLSPPEIQNLDGGHYLITVKGEFAIGGAVIQAVGARASNDPFFTDRYQGEGEKRHRVTMPGSEVDRGDVIKSAVSNCTGNGVKKLLGLMNMTWQDLEDYGAIKQADVQGFQFKSKAPTQAGKPAAKPADNAVPADPGALATEPQVKAIHAILRERLKITDELAKMQKVAQILALKEVPTSLTKLSKADASKVIEALNKEVAGGEE
jgi:hypothetical protein